MRGIYNVNLKNARLLENFWMLRIMYDIKCYCKSVLLIIRDENYSISIKKIFNDRTNRYVIIDS